MMAEHGVDFPLNDDDDDRAPRLAWGHRTAMSMIAARATAEITSLRVYPIKSCAGHEVQQATLGDRGLDMDRLWMIVDRSGRFMTQRRCAKMALVSPSLPGSKDEVRRNREHFFFVYVVPACAQQRGGGIGGCGRAAWVLRRALARGLTAEEMSSG